MDTMKEALTDQLQAELDAYGEDANAMVTGVGYSEVPIKILQGNSRQFLQMKSAGYFSDDSFEVITHNLDYYDSLSNNYSPNDLINIKGIDYLIKTIEALDNESGVKLILDKLK